MNGSGVSSTLAEEEIEAGERFAFGENWASFLRLVDESRISSAVEGLTSWLGTEGWKGARFLDIGSGSGLSSLAARRLGAQVYSFDFDQSSVECTRALKARFRPDDGDEAWRVTAGSALDQTFLSGLGVFDIVYSWGVLHHTGELWTALANSADRVAPGGRLHVALYNDQGYPSRAWKRLKERYNRAAHRERQVILAGAATYFRLRSLAAAVKNRTANAERPRGMDRRRDLVDWVGGYPFEVSRPEEVFDFVTQRGFSLTRLSTCGGGLGCNQFVFTREG
jgi:2-polyprenyl-6-hydroxyphenyl methylase/3-demethylubiquinone-9 3-methyltransferase